jgi:hypothetical protein
MLEETTMRMTKLLASAAVLALLASPSAAQDRQALADRLGQDLTPMGAERAGNADGTIPAWTGGLGPDDVNYDPATQNPPNFFAGDQPRFTITAGNMAQYADKLTPGYQALLSTYDSYKMTVYPSRRVCAYPQEVYDANRRNVLVGDLTPDGNGIVNSVMGAPFPIVTQGLHAVWNHTLRYRGFKLTRQFAAAPVTAGGSYTLLRVQDEAIIHYNDPSITTTAELDNVSLRYISNTIAPARAAGSIILVHETINQAVRQRDAWQYSPGTRRVRRAPNIAYDNPGTNTDALSTSDSFDGYNGSPDRYDWNLVGKVERFIAYNNYDATNARYAQLLGQRHLNQDLVRYELHRVWQVDATLRPDTRHVYARRVKYFNEDSHALSTAELYDGRGELWRIQEVHQQAMPHVPLCATTAEVVYDLQNGRYLALALRNEEPPVNYFANELDESRYQPARLRQLGVR